VRAGVKQTIRRSRGDETHFKFGFWISVRASSRRLLRHGAGESFAVPLKIRAHSATVALTMKEIIGEQIAKKLV